MNKTDYLAAALSHIPSIKKNVYKTTNCIQNGYAQYQKKKIRPSRRQNSTKDHSRGNSPAICLWAVYATLAVQCTHERSVPLESSLWQSKNRSPLFFLSLSFFFLSLYFISLVHSFTHSPIPSSLHCLTVLHQRYSHAASYQRFESNPKYQLHL